MYGDKYYKKYKRTRKILSFVTNEIQGVNPHNYSTPFCNNDSYTD